MMTGYVELHVTSNFSFLEGGSHPDELIMTAAALGLDAIAVTDRNTLSGIVRAHVAAKRHGIRLVVGCRLELEDGLALLCFPTDRAAYGRLCHLLTLGQRRAQKGQCRISLEDVACHALGQIFIILPPDLVKEAPLAEDIKRQRAALGPDCYLAASYRYRGNDRARLAKLARLAEICGTPLLATGNVYYHTPARRPLQDILTCIREGCTISTAGFRLAANAERHLKPASETRRLFKGYEAAVSLSLEIAARCRFNLDELKYNYPDEPVPKGTTAQQHLEALTWAGAHMRYPGGLPDKIRATLNHELALIAALKYAPYFLTVHDIVAWARGQDILCQGRGSAANSAVCFCLFITSVDPAEIDLLFERFISAERDEPPDIDVDFEHERREEVIQYIYARYGRERAGLAATVITYRTRSAVREVGKALGLSEDITSALAGMVWGWSDHGMPDAHVREAGLDPADDNIKRALELTATLIGFPRHLSQHVGGFILTRDPLCEIVPIGNAAMEDRTFIEWDKDDLDALGILKIDVLALGMLTCIRKCITLMADHYGDARDLADFFPANDIKVYDMLCRADSVGVFQIESRAQMNMLPRLKPRNFYDLVIEVAIVRPGPIQGDMVHPYLRRRDGLEAVTFPSPAPQHGPANELANVLGKTLGVPLFQEQAMRLAIDAAKFTPGEANELRRAMATFRRRGTIGELEEKFISRMVSRGYQSDFARRCFDQIKGFGDYGFPESHAASFALLVYVSASIKYHYPATFACGLLNSQPMGFYAPAQIVRDAREHGVTVLPVDVNHSDFDCRLEKIPSGVWALRLGFRLVDGLGAQHAHAIVAARHAPYRKMHDVQKHAGVPVFALEKLAAADGFNGMGLSRRQALWEVRGLAHAATPLPLFKRNAQPDTGPEEPARLPAMPLPEQVIADYQTLRLSLKAHPLSFLRDSLQKRGIVTAGRLKSLKDGAKVAVAGLVLVRQRPGTASGVIFITLEDETGVTNAVIWPKIMEQNRRTVMSARLLVIYGKMQRQADIIHIIALKLEDASPLLDNLPGTDEAAARPAPQTQAVARHPRQQRIIPKSRDFH
jgi:error-prone DNA polymerase